MSSSAVATLSAPRAGTTRAASLEFRAVGQAFAARRGSRAEKGAHDAVTRVLRDVHLTLVPGEIVALLGPSGSGKSTLLRIAAGLDTPAEGELLVDGTPSTGISERCAVGFQEPRLAPWLSVQENVALGLPRTTDRREGQASVERLLHLVGLDHCAGYRPAEISGGMAQRASLARALARRPGVLLLDEPFGALDALTRMKMQDLLLRVHEAEPTTVLLVTHDVDEALQLADRVVVLGSDHGIPGARVKHVLEVPGARPRDRDDAALVGLRRTLLTTLGVDTHHH
ncbi:ABC transporter ATP-binding protein [Sinomonas halotolerans]|uniref:ABC transporter ATP-binding protein n=1 Tax=Sinomonas halotolerans TaxID=1644133 RepID=A0ABU9WXQ6_9MICC